MNNHELNNTGEDNEAKLFNTPFARMVGRVAIGTLFAYAGLKIGEDIFHYALPYYKEIGVATAISVVSEAGSAAVNA